MTIEKCPTCGGQRTVSKPPWIAGDVDSWVGSGVVLYQCPTCEGKGYLVV